MGLPDAVLIDGQDGHVAEYVCAVCVSLVDAPMLTRCQHIFCMSCLQTWMDNKPSCPTCSVELDPRHGAGDLRLASPLAWRVLGRLRVRCPLAGCEWKGEYSELMSHMTSSTSHQVPTASGPGSTAESRAAGVGATPVRSASATAEATENALSQAASFNSAAKSKFEQRIFGDALTLYSKAIALVDGRISFLRLTAELEISQSPSGAPTRTKNPQRKKTKSLLGSGVRLRHGYVPG